MAKQTSDISRCSSVCHPSPGLPPAPPSLPESLASRVDSQTGFFTPALRYLPPGLRQIHETLGDAPCVHAADKRYLGVLNACGLRREASLLIAATPHAVEEAQRHIRSPILAIRESGDEMTFFSRSRTSIRDPLLGQLALIRNEVLGSHDQRAFVEAVVRIRESFERASETHAGGGPFSTAAFLRSIAKQMDSALTREVQAFRCSALGEYIQDSLRSSLADEDAKLRKSAAQAVVAAYFILQAGFSKQGSPFPPGTLVMSSVQLPPANQGGYGWEDFARAYATGQKEIYRQKRNGKIEADILPVESVTLRREELDAAQRSFEREEAYQAFLKHPSIDIATAVHFLTCDIHRPGVLREELLRPLEVQTLLATREPLSVIAVDIPGAGSINGFAGFSRTNEILNQIAAPELRDGLLERQLVVSSGGATYILGTGSVQPDRLQAYEQALQQFAHRTLFLDANLPQEMRERMVMDYVCRLVIRSMTSALQQDPEAPLRDLCSKPPSAFALGKVAVQVHGDIRVQPQETFGQLLDRLRG